MHSILILPCLAVEIKRKSHFPVIIPAKPSMCRFPDLKKTDCPDAVRSIAQLMAVFQQHLQFAAFPVCVQAHADPMLLIHMIGWKDALMIDQLLRRGLEVDDLAFPLLIDEQAVQFK